MMRMITIELTLLEAEMLSACAENGLGGDEQDAEGVCGKSKAKYSAAVRAMGKLDKAIYASK